MQPVGYINRVYKMLYDAAKGQIYVDDVCKEISKPFFIKCVKLAVKDRIGSNLNFRIELNEEIGVITKK